ncbi:SusC/RagA family TonB-linked outer membrane protein [Chitinophaga sp. sic0106]|uniref:SusC/RagA family TonB-linked outer membrane protein n=1 Tax=Chitinophaga sp. sic0106 TaxID=2854785 RepID=UPI001C4901CA|nr:SusC/RagA family TonB-linked outer membrane protein [Chitinophaga sp. sic0106]MBV7528589.1 SusC/RagA family TonB-linked outer membrane protein [Chitinophaga sp. sic0106]
MTKSRLLRHLFIAVFAVLVQTVAFAQNKSFTGKVTDEKGSPIPGATIAVKGTKSGTATDPEGNYKLASIPANATLVISFVGYKTQEVSTAGKASADISLQPESSTLSDVVVVGYGTTRKKDLTGAVASIKSAEFNGGITTAPDQLIQGKVSGLMILNNSGAPGAASTVRIRGLSSPRAGNQPLYVIDGVPLDGRVARPAVNAAGLGQTPDANPMNFINGLDIASMDVLKDASATAIYGSRGSNGVIMINTRKGSAGPARLDFNYSAGVSNIMKKLEVLNADEYRSALKDYNLNAGDYGSNSDGMESILRTGVSQNFHVALSGGSETSRYRASFGYQDQQGIIRKTGLKKITATLNGQNTFLSKNQLGVDYNVMTAQTLETLAPISNDAGFTGSLIGQALQWNPTMPLRNADGSFYLLGAGSSINPLAMSEAYDDNANITYVLGSVSPYFKFNDNLELRAMYSINHQVGIRKSQIASFINIAGVQDLGQAYYGNSELNTQLFNSTLTYSKQVTSAFNLRALVGYEYQEFDYEGMNLGALGFPTYAIDYVHQLQSPTQANTFMSSFKNPTSKLQSYFARAEMNFYDKYLLNATVRMDGSSKFGSSNHYGTFPSFAAKWNINNENFMKGGKLFQTLALRAGWGMTGNQEFPAGASEEQYMLNSGGASGLGNVANPGLKWETSKQLNVGIDFGIVDNRITGTIDYFNKNTTNLLFSFPAIQPAPASSYWINMPGNVLNKGLEFSVRGDVIRKKNLIWTIGVNGTFLTNELKNYDGPPVLTGSISGQGVSGATSQRLANGYALNTFYMRKFQGFDDKGQATYADNGDKLYYLTNPNPKTMLGINTSLEYKNLSFRLSSHGAFGYQVYNNTANTVLPIGNLGSRNIAKALLGNGESLSNPITVSSRYLENGNFLKLDNISVGYNFGDVAKIFRGTTLTVTGQNLFVITKYSGFDPEVNTDKSVNGISSFGIEYSPYPTARSVMFSLSFSL